MKKSILFGAGTLLLLAASCSNDEVVMRPESQAIGFKTTVDKSQSRAETAGNVDDDNSVTTSNLKHFHVWGYKLAKEGSAAALIFNNQSVTGGSGGWSYEPIQYWGANQTYSFVALSSNMTACSSTFTPGEAPTADADKGFGKVSFNNQAAEGMEDVICATQGRVTDGTLSEETVKNVLFSFKHILTRMKFTFINGMSTAYQIQVSNLTVNGVKVSGDYDVVTSSWQANDGAFNLTFKSKEQIEGSYLNATTGRIEFEQSKSISPHYILPGEQTLTVTFDVRVFNGDSQTSTTVYTHTAKPLQLPNSATEYLAGHSYNFQATITPKNINPDEALKPIRFTASVEDWIDEEGGSVVLPDKNTPTE